MSANRVNKRQNRGARRSRLSLGSVDNLHNKLSGLCGELGVPLDPPELAEPPAPVEDTGLADILVASLLLVTAGLLNVQF